MPGIEAHLSSSGSSGIDSVPQPPKLEDDDLEDEEHSSENLHDSTGTGATEDHLGDSKKKIRKRDIPGKAAKAVVHTVVPKIERVPWYIFLWLSLLVAAPCAIYIVCFTALGMGLEWFDYLDEHYGDSSATIAACATTGWFLLAYLMDVDSWRSRPWTQRLIGLIFCVGLVATVILMVRDYPYLPICIFAALTPLWLISVNQVVRAAHTRDYVGWLSGPLFFVSMVIMILWIVWVFMDEIHEYNSITTVAFAQATGCAADLEGYPECRNGYAPIVPNTTATIPVNRFLHVLQDGGAYHAFMDHHNNQNITNNDLVEPSTTTRTMNMNSVPAQGEIFMSQAVTDVCFSVILSPPAFVWPDDQVCDESCPDNVYKECPNGFILWSGPLLVSLVLFFLSFFCTFLRNDNAEKDIINFGKLWLFLLFTIWLTASLAGVGAGLSSLLVALTLASFVGSIIFVAMTRSRTEGKAQAKNVWQRISENYGPQLDFARALFLVTLAPILVIYFVLSVMNQHVRKLGLPFSKELKTAETRKDYITKRTRAQLHMFQSWDRAKVLTYAVYWGIAFMVMIVIVAQFTVLFLSWLIEVTSTMNVGAVTAILCGVGMIMFLLPPVPGVPIYLTLGIVIAAVGRDMFGVVGSMFYASGVSLALKLVACAVQQKVIGENLSKYTSIRKMVGINTTIIKAMRLILSQPGMGIDKVCILVGGPDWPTSVLCGLLGLDLLPILFGTLPVFLLIAPTVLTGSFTYMNGSILPDGTLEFPSAGVLGTVFAAATAIVQFAAMILAAYYLEQTTSQRAEEIAAIEDDEEVAKLERDEVHLNNCYIKVTQWEVVPTICKLTLYAAFWGMVTCCYMVQIFADQCFADYQLTYTIDEYLDGKWYTLLKPFGWYAVIIFVCSCILLCGFVSWANGEAQREAARNPPKAHNQSEEQALPAVLSD